jgi:hypothetical protein
MEKNWNRIMDGLSFLLALAICLIFIGVAGVAICGIVWVAFIESGLWKWAPIIPVALAVCWIVGYVGERLERHV